MTVIPMKQKENAPKPPAHLSKPMQAWWASVVAEYVLEDHHLLLLTKACEAHDRADQAREILNREGLTFNDRFLQPCARPECAIERDSRTAFARLLRELNLSEADAEAPRPPRLAYGKKR